MTFGGRWLRLIIFAFFPSASAALAEGLSLQIPVDCDFGGNCYIQQYMDRDPEQGFTDYRCGGLSYDGHKGTDFAVNNRAIMQAGVNVLAAADGIVRGYRDGMDDAGYSKEVAAKIEGRECGNGVVLTHPGGWETQYCHLKNGTVSLRNGQKVAAGEVLGQIGQSGKAEFPHLHFSVRQNGKPVDPFDPGGELTCGTAPDDSLWAEPPRYLAGGVIEVGFSDAVPPYDAVKAGGVARAALPTDAPAIVIYGFTYGTQPGDVLRLVITGPEGEVISQDTTLERNHAQAYRAIGKRRRPWSRWAEGTYSGTATLLRDGQVVSQRQVGLVISKGA